MSSLPTLRQVLLYTNLPPEVGGDIEFNLIANEIGGGAVASPTVSLNTGVYRFVHRMHALVDDPFVPTPHREVGTGVCVRE